MRNTTIKKYDAIHLRLNELYNVERRRYDDCIQMICKEFYLSEKRVNYVLSSVSVPKSEPQTSLDLRDNATAQNS